MWTAEATPFPPDGWRSKIPERRARMERSRLKTIIILILAMMNLALALSLGLRL